MKYTITARNDALKSLSELGFASRLKRLSERLMRDVSRVYHELDVQFEARWFSLLYTLANQPSASITELSDQLGLTHPAINQTAGEMTKAGLIKSAKDKADERRRVLSLTAKGRRMVGRLQPVWKEIRRATAELLDESEVSILHELDKIEARLDRLGMYERILTGKKGNDNPVFQIVDYRPAYKKHFKALNLEWINKYFELEPIDEVLLSDPNGKIIRKGGAILYVIVSGKVAGVCALIRQSETSYELSKMAVTAEFQGYGLGRALGEAVIERARELGAEKIFLLTNDRLDIAMSLYHKLGFKGADRLVYGADKYERCTVAMELALTIKETKAKKPSPMGKRKIRKN